MQHKINLLPWREHKREEHKRRFVSLVALGALIAVGIQ
ncbi:pilus assembly protein PilN, partial [Vibrio vulnificus]